MPIEFLVIITIIFTCQLITLLGYINKVAENRRLRKYIRERYLIEKQEKPKDLEYGEKS